MAVEITEEFVWQNIPPRARDSHKGTFGSVLAVAGSAFYRGAALLAAEGALRTGAGIVTLASVEPVVGAAVTRLPECCLCPCKEGAQGGIAPENVPLLRRQKATVLLLGPGLGGTAQSAARATETRTLVQQLLPGFAGAAVLDADGLNAAAPDEQSALDSHVIQRDFTIRCAAADNQIAVHGQIFQFHVVGTNENAAFNVLVVSAFGHNVSANDVVKNLRKF